MNTLVNKKHKKRHHISKDHENSTINAIHASLMTKNTRQLVEIKLTISPKGKNGVKKTILMFVELQP
jgi:hypothetical protein